MTFLIRLRKLDAAHANLIPWRRQFRVKVQTVLFHSRVWILVRDILVGRSGGITVRIINSSFFYFFRKMSDLFIAFLYDY